MLIMKFACYCLLKILLLRMRPQETTVDSSIENLLSRIVALETRFATRPGDVEEQRRRSELIQYVIIPLS